MALPSDLSFADSLTSKERLAFYERHQFLAVGMIIILFFLPLVGLFAAGLFGIVTGVMIPVTAYYLAPYVVQKLS